MCVYMYIDIYIYNSTRFFLQKMKGAIYVPSIPFKRRKKNAIGSEMNCAIYVP